MQRGFNPRNDISLESTFFKAWRVQNLDQLQNWWQQLVDQQEQSQVLPNAIDQRSRYAMKRSRSVAKGLSFRQRRSLVPLTGLI
ncbi:MULTISPECIES: hypothetical protein [unclassified Moorena]|uniref:hypothetical protein n=1 Tax=unclassified Moorena TaxID=2683338 RepID=UPI0013CBD3D3|nr:MULTISPECIES: hypothetical protein [unclassified Moorena]NEO22532.1 hypothetical protein [Moorena sp. SIO4A5]NEQ60095.1 hypothetical protein [Moorena sp. SIO4A1]